MAQAPDQAWTMPEEMLMLGHEAWIEGVKNIKISRFHSEVSRLFSAMGIPHTLETLTEGSLFSGAWLQFYRLSCVQLGSSHQPPSSSPHDESLVLACSGHRSARGAHRS